MDIKTYLQNRYNTSVRKAKTKPTIDTYYFKYDGGLIGKHDVSLSHYTNINKYSLEVKTNKKLGTNKYYKESTYQLLAFGYPNLETALNQLSNVLTNRLRLIK